MVSNAAFHPVIFLTPYRCKRSWIRPQSANLFRVNAALTNAVTAATAAGRCDTFIPLLLFSHPFRLAASLHGTWNSQCRTLSMSCLRRSCCRYYWCGFCRCHVTGNGWRSALFFVLLYPSPSSWRFSAALCLAEDGPGLWLSGSLLPPYIGAELRGCFAQTTQQLS